MIEECYDVVVIGGGPGGLAAALELTRLGFYTALFEKKTEIGTPIRCGEMTMSTYHEIVNVKRKEEHIQNSYGDFLILYRNRFEMYLAEEISRQRGRVFTRMYVSDILPYNGEETGIVVETMTGEKRVIRSKAVVIAEGVEGLLARRAGFDTYLSPSDVGSCYSAKLDNIEIENSWRTEINVMLKPVPFSFWIFPLSPHSANVGVGLPGSYGYRAREVFYRFIAERTDLHHANVSREIVGVVPMTKPIERPYSDGILLVGTAARLVESTTGAGIGYALLSGVEAAQTLNLARAKGDYRAPVLSHYRKRLESVYEQLYKVYKIRTMQGLSTVLANFGRIGQ